MSDQPLLAVERLNVGYGSGRRANHVVHDVGFTIRASTTFGLVGESGSGKTTIGRAVLGLVPATGSIRFCGQEMVGVSKRVRRRVADGLQVVFQDPFSSFNPSRTVGTSLLESALARGATREEGVARMELLLERVGLSADVADKFPAKFSGGQRQRLAIARALMTSPKLVVCDEAVSALDVSVQAQVLNLLRELQRDFELSYLFISHDIDVVRYMSDEVMVLRRGHVVEAGGVDDVVDRPRDPYTQALIAASPDLVLPT